MAFLGIGKKNDVPKAEIDLSRVLNTRSPFADDVPAPPSPLDAQEDEGAEEPLLEDAPPRALDVIRNNPRARDALKARLKAEVERRAAAHGPADPAPTEEDAAPMPEITASPAPAPAAEEPQGVSLLERLTPAVVWAAMVLVLVSVVYGIAQGEVNFTVAAIFAAGVLLFGSLLVLASATRAYSPLLLAGLMLRPRARKRGEPAVLAGGDILAALGLAESILDADPDARLVTTRNGVVVYGNDAYLAIAREAGVIGPTGLPPRIDRLFGQAGTESSKMFRLVRAARSGIAAEEIITQTMGTATSFDSMPRRRFEVAVRPMNDAGHHIAWRLREVPIESNRDTLRIAYADYPRPVFALEKSGTLAWMNKAMAQVLSTRPDAAMAVGDFLLGEATEIIAAMWEPEPEECEGRIRPRGTTATPQTVIFTAFGRGGVGEGFVCVEMLPKTGLLAERGAADLAADVSEAPFGVAVVEGDPGTDATFASVNKRFADFFGAEQKMRLSEALPQPAMRDLVAALRSRAQSQPLTRPVEVSIGEGAAASIFRVFARPIGRRRGSYGPRQTVLYAVDVSFQKRMEEDYAHDKRLTAIGKIAGSVAHDFNNFLQAILGATELLMRTHPAGDPSYADLVSIRENGQRARNLTQNLLAFSRKQTLQSEVLSVSEMLADFTPFVQRLMTEKVKVDVKHGRTVPAVKADKSQLELAIMNLAVNARDAMDKGGMLTISSAKVPAAKVSEYGYPQLEEVDHVLIEVSDTGTGVPAEIADKIFEPFFTTKGEGKGTGLGLSTVHGIIGQMGGRIFLHNRPGEGATFRIFLPSLSEEETAEALKQKAVPETSKTPVDDLTGKGRILIVEDEDSVRSIVVRKLAMCGYDIVEATDGEEALDLIEEAREPFDVVLSDIMMPEMDGPTLIHQAGDKLKGAKVIFMSGYAETAMRDKLGEIKDARYLQKPFTLQKVAATVKEAIAERG